MQIKTKNSLSGFSVDVVNELLAITGFSAEIQVLPWARAIKTAEAQENTMIFSITRTPERESLFKWVGALGIDTNLYFWSLKSRNNIKISGWTDVKEMKTAIPREDSQIGRLRKKGFSESKNLYITNDLSQSLQMLKQGRIDFLLAGDLYISYYMSELNFSRKDFKRHSYLNTKHYPLSIAFSKNTPDKTVQIFRDALHQIKINGRLKNLYDTWIERHNVTR